MAGYKLIFHHDSNCVNKCLTIQLESHDFQELP